MDRPPQSNLAIPDSVRNSPLMKKGGFDVFEGLLDSDTLSLMLSEAVGLSAAATQSHVPMSDGEQVRGGSPARRFLSAPGGQVQAAFYHAGWMLGFLHDLCDTQIAPTGSHGTYTFYAQTGDHLIVHRDIQSCDVAVITCLYDHPGPADAGGMLYLYPGRISEPLSTIRATPEQGAVRVRLMPGLTIVMFGGIVPHAVLPVVERQVRIVSVLCYQY